MIDLDVVHICGFVMQLGTGLVVGTREALEGNSRNVERVFPSKASSSYALTLAARKADMCGEHINVSCAPLPKVMLLDYAPIDSSTNAGRAHIPPATSKKVQCLSLA